MPNNESLEQFNDVLIETGDEPRIAAERGEIVEPVAAPQPGEFDAGTPADSAAASADDFYSNLSESLEESEDAGEIEGLTPPGEDFLSDLGLGDEEPPLADFGLDELDEGPSGDISGDLDSALEGFGDLGEEPAEEVDFGDLSEDMGEPVDLGDLSEDLGEPVDLGDPGEEPFESSDFSDLGEEPDFGEEGDFIESSDLPEEDIDAALGGVDEDFGEAPGEEFGAATGTGPDMSEPAGEEVPADVFGGDFGLDETGDEGSEEDFDLGDFGIPETGDAEAPGEEDFGLGGLDASESGDLGAGDFGADAFAADEFEAGDFDADEFSTEDFGDSGDFDAFEAVEEAEMPAEETPGEEFAPASEDETVPSDEFSISDDLEGGLELSDESGDLSFGEEDFGSDDFGAFDGGEESAAGDEFGAADFGAEEPAAGLEDFGDFDADFDSGDFGDEFSMGDFGEEFGIMEEEAASPVGAEEAPSPEAGAVFDEALEEAAAEDESAGFGITDEQFGDLKKTVAYLPLNLKIAASEAIVSDEYSFESIQPLIQALYEQQSPRDIARIVSKITGRRIEIPRGYEKRSGLSFEEERKTFAYQFRETIWPILRLMLLGAAVLGTSLYFGYRFIYQPLFARNLYEQGLQDIQVQEYEQANRLFNQAYEIWPVKTRFLDYANDFIDVKQYALAREKFETLLGDNIAPLNRQGILEYAEFATYKLRDYSTALDYLQRLLTEDTWDYDARLAHGDAYLEWGRITEGPGDQASYFEQARYDYASLMQKYGETDELLFHMLRYLISTDKVEEVLAQKDLWLNDEAAELDPEGLTELAGFLLDLSEAGITGRSAANSEELVDQYISDLRGDDQGSNLLKDALKIINKVMQLDDSIPEVHYYRARYARLTGDLQDEIVALKNARELYEETQAQRPLDRFEISREIDTYIREGEYLYKLDQIASSEQRLLEAIGIYERALDARKVEPHPMYGRAYALLGDIYYYHANIYFDSNSDAFDSAYDLYQSARQNKYGSVDKADIQAYPGYFKERQDLAYKLGYIDLFRAKSFDIKTRNDKTRQQELLEEAITEFNNAQGAIPTANLNLLYARANTQYMRGVYYDAASMYRILLDELTSERRSISTFLLDEDQRHKALIDFQIRVNNNLGVTLYRLYRQGGENTDGLLGQSQLFLSRSAELSENLARDPDTAVRAQTKSLAYDNLHLVLSPNMGDQVQIDPDIRKDLEAPTF